MMIQFDEHIFQMGWKHQLVFFRGPSFSFLGGESQFMLDPDLWIGGSSKTNTTFLGVCVVVGGPKTLNFDVNPLGRPIKTKWDS